MPSQQWARRTYIRCPDGEDCLVTETVHKLSPNSWRSPWWLHSPPSAWLPWWWRARSQKTHRHGVFLLLDEAARETTAWLVSATGRCSADNKKAPHPGTDFRSAQILSIQISTQVLQPFLQSSYLVLSFAFRPPLALSKPFSSSILTFHKASNMIELICTWVKFR